MNPQPEDSLKNSMPTENFLQYFSYSQKLLFNQIYTTGHKIASNQVFGNYQDSPTDNLRIRYKNHPRFLSLQNFATNLFRSQPQNQLTGQENYAISAREISTTDPC